MPKLARWAMCIQELDLKIRHRSWKSNLVADALSRHPLPVADMLQVVADARVEDIAKLQRQDDELVAIFQWLEGGGLPADPHQAQYLKAEHSNSQPKITSAGTKETSPAPPYTGPVTRSRSEQN